MLLSTRLKYKQSKQQQQISNQTINYYVDNQAAIQSLGKYCINSRQVLDCKMAINQLALNNNPRGVSLGKSDPPPKKKY